VNSPYEPPVAITAAVSYSPLGMTLDEAEKSILKKKSVLRPLSDQESYNGKYPHIFAGWLPNRTALMGRKYGCASNAAIRAVKQLLESTAWSRQDIREAWIFAASSRGNIAEIAGANTTRRPIAIYSASNTLHSEIAAAVSIECGITAPWQLLSNGCSSGLDAIAWAAHVVSTGLAPRAIVVAADLPLNDLTLTAFARSGVLSHTPTPDPFHPQTTGFTPAEAVTALSLEKKDGPVRLLGAWMAADAHDPVGLPSPQKSSLHDLITKSIHYIRKTNPHVRLAICPHASGTAAHAALEPAVLEAAAKAHHTGPLRVLLTKPWSGHALGASGALDVALLWQFLRRGVLPPNLSPSCRQSVLLDFPTNETDARSTVVLKISTAMGGLNTLLALTSHY
jgi:3-oxoacyl-[acyl-carrier-protein] synthase II